MNVWIPIALALGPAVGVPAPAKATFEVRHEVTVTAPEGAGKVRVWFAVPQDEPAQQVRDLKVEAPFPWRMETDSEGNKVLYLEAEKPKPGAIPVVTTFTVTRTEVRTALDPARAKPLSEEEKRKFEKFLQANQNVVIDDRIRALAGEIVGTETNSLRAARKIYDWVLDNVDYWVKDPQNKKASPVGSTEYCLTTKTGNCTDFHSLWTSLARAKGIPTRMVYGSFLKKELDGQDVDASYHCWPEFYVSGIGWIPHDVAVADIVRGGFEVTDANATLVRRTTADGYEGPSPDRVDYYFGNLEERRVVLSSGRDLTLNPKQQAGPVNALPKAYVEVDGKPLPEKEGWVRKLTYREKK